MEILAALAAVADSGPLQFGLVVTVFLAGLRHGFDLDHIAALADISSSTLARRRALTFATAYIVGHAAVLIVLGASAVIAGRSIPAEVEGTMGRVIGFTLLVLGAHVVYSLLRFQRDFKMQSRWMLILSSIKRTSNWLRRTRTRTVEIEHEHPHPVGGHHHALARLGETLSSERGTQLVATDVHTHTHTHVVEVPSDPFDEYRVATCAGVGMIHGVGAETPSQLILFMSAANVTSALGGLVLVGAFVAGLMLGNTVLAIGITAGFAKGQRVPVAYMVIAGTTAVMSAYVGLLYMLGRPDLLPAFLGG